MEMSLPLVFTRTYIGYSSDELCRHRSPKYSKIRPHQPNISGTPHWVRTKNTDLDPQPKPLFEGAETTGLQAHRHGFAA